jgi:hypothetical protein
MTRHKTAPANKTSQHKPAELTRKLKCPNHITKTSTIPRAAALCVCMLSSAVIMWNWYLGFGVLGLWYEIYGSRLRVYGAGFKVEGLLRFEV